MRAVPPKLKRSAFNATPQQGHIQCKGGLSLVQPRVVNDPGFVTDSMNFEVSQYGGYRRIAGYERYDGKPSPSLGYYHRGVVTFSGAVVVGNTVTGVTSGSTAIVIAIEGDALIVTKVSAPFTANEVLNVGGSPVATLVGDFIGFGASTAYLNARYNALAADEYRQDIGAVPGAGPVLGVWWYEGKVYAFRNTVLGTSCVMHVESPAGWTAVDLGKQVAYTLGNTVAIGDTLTQGAVTATIMGITMESGAMTGSAAGRLIISNLAGGNFAAGAATTTSGTVTLSGAQTSITLAPGGRFEFDNYAFANTVKMYGCDGVNSEFEFDGTTFIPLNNGGSVKASFIVGHSHHLITLCMARLKSQSAPLARDC